MNETPMRLEYFIKDKDLVELVKNIFITADQLWTDTQAYEISKLIEDYMAKKQQI
jgi:hypothetical protein